MRLPDIVRKLRDMSSGVLDIVRSAGDTVPVLQTLEASMNKLGGELKRLRTVKRASLRDVEEAVEISNAYLSQLERGEVKQPSPHWLFKLAGYYNVPYESLMAAAGYIDEKKLAAGTKRPLSTLERMLMSANLSPDEESEVRGFVEYVTSRRKKGE